MKLTTRDLFIGVCLIGIGYLMFFKPVEYPEIDYKKQLDVMRESRYKEQKIVKRLNQRHEKIDSLKNDPVALDSLHDDFLRRSGFNK